MSHQQRGDKRLMVVGEGIGGGGGLREVEGVR